MPPTSSPSDTDAMLAAALLTFRSNSLPADHRDEKEEMPCATPPRHPPFPDEDMTVLSDKHRTPPAVDSPVSRFFKGSYGVASSALPQTPHGELPRYDQVTVGVTGNLSFQSHLRASSYNSKFVFSTTTSNCLPLVQSSFAPQAPVQSLQQRPAPKSEVLQTQPRKSQKCGTESVDVRSEQVEKALRSKPQRGRKRDCLVGAERLERTRNRNREHACNTRLRKKARFQELEEKEKKLQVIEEERHLDSQRRQSLVDFFAMRERMAHKLAHSGSKDDDVDIFDVSDFIEDVDDFKFDECDETSESAAGFDAMKQFDAAIFRRTSHRFGTEAVHLLTYSVSAHDIALNLVDGALLEVDLLLRGEPSLKLLSAHLVVKFAPRSKKILSVKWHTTKDAFDVVSFDRLCKGPGSLCSNFAPKCGPSMDI
jgi:hypothetical protein